MNIFDVLRDSLLVRRVFPELGESSTQQMPSSADDRFPVVVRPATKQFLTMQAGVLRTSLASAAGLILDHVANQTHPADQFSLRMIAERLRGLVRTHGISIPAAAELLGSFGLGLAQFSDDDLLCRSLTSETVAKIAALFCVKYEWLVGFEAQPARSELFWDKRVTDGLRRILDAVTEADEVEFILVAGPKNPFQDERKRSRSTDYDEIVPVLVRRRRIAKTQETFTSYECWDSTRWDYGRTRAELKLLIYAVNLLESGEEGTPAWLQGRVRMMGYCLEKEEYTALRDFKVLPAIILGRPRSIAWHPCDYVEANSACALEKEEWAEIMTWTKERKTLDALKQMIIDAAQSARPIH